MRQSASKYFCQGWADLERLFIHDSQTLLQPRVDTTDELGSAEPSQLLKTRVCSVCNHVATIQPIAFEGCILEPDKEEPKQICLGDELFSFTLP